MEKGFNERTASGEIRTVWEEVDGPKTNEWTRAQMQEYLLDKAKRQDLDEDIVGVLDTPDILAEDMKHCFEQVSEKFTIVNTRQYGTGYIISGFNSTDKINAYLDQHLYIEKHDNEDGTRIEIRGMNDPGEFEHYNIEKNVVFTAGIDIPVDDIASFRFYFGGMHEDSYPFFRVNIKETFQRLLDEKIKMNREDFNVDPRVITERLFRIITPYLTYQNEKTTGSSTK